MNECNSIKSNSIKYNSPETIDKTILCEQTKFWLCEIIGIEKEINQSKSCSKKLNKCYNFWLYRQNFNCFKCNN